MELVFEIVRVLDERSLVNSESYQCNYRTGLQRGYGKGLEPGYYVVMWETPEAMSYDESARFVGPCRSRAEAIQLAEHAAYSSRGEAQAARVLH